MESEATQFLPTFTHRYCRRAVKFYFLSAGDVTLWGAGWGLGEKWLRDFDKERPFFGVGKSWKEKALG